MISAITLIIFICTSAAGHNVAVHLRIPPLGGAKPTVCLSIRLSSLTKTPPLSSSSLQAQRQQCLCCGLGQDGGAVVERERSRGEEESPEDDTEAVTQPHDWKYTHVDCWRRHTPARWNGPIGHAGGHRFPPTPTTLYLLSLPQPINSFSQLTPLSCLFIHTFSSPPAVYQPGVTVHLSSFPPSFRPPVYLSQTFHLLTSSQLLWLRSILYSQNSTVYVMQKVSTMTKKINLKYPTAVTYRIWTYTDYVRQAVLLSLFYAIGFSLIHEWFWRRGTVSFHKPPFLLYGWWIFFLQAVAKWTLCQTNQEISFLYGMRQNE